MEQTPNTPTVEMRARILALETSMRALPQLQFETKHWFAEGMYAREIFIPKGAVLTGKIHKTEHINVVLQGDISVATEEGIKRIRAPLVFVAPAGTKRAGYAHEDTIWITFHATREQDLELIERDLIARDFNELDAFQKLRLETQKCPG